jgi:beta-phosphoglucomutase family hydrolase
MSKPSFDAVIFDLDGVITKTASVHSAAWKQMFDEFLKAYAERTGEPFHEFTHEEDYLPYVDGKPRYDGVASFLESRTIDLPRGDPSDTPGMETISGLGNRKNLLFNEMIDQGRVEVFPTTLEFINELLERGIKVGVATSSRNGKKLLEAVGIADLMGTLVDGVVSAELQLKGKPEPDIFMIACDDLGALYDRAVIVEDAVSGVKAGQNGRFGLVLGVARENNEITLKQNGADIVVSDLSEISFSDVELWFREGLEEEQWTLNYAEYEPAQEGTREALCTVGNGYIGTRGAFEEVKASEVNYPGTYIAGIYNRLESNIAGRTIVNEDFVNCPNWLPMTFKLGDGGWFDPNSTQVLRFERQLDFRNGVLQRSMLVRDPSGRETRLESWRMASMAHPHLVALRYSITPMNYDETITIRSSLDGVIENSGVERYRQLNSRHLEPSMEGGQGDTSYIVLQTNQSGIQIAEAAKLFVMVEGDIVDASIMQRPSPGIVHTQFSVEAQRGKTIFVDKLVAIYTSRDHADAPPLEQALGALESLSGFEVLLEASAAAWAEIWDEVDIQIEGDRYSQKLLRLNLYHTLISASPHNTAIDAGIPARGLHGEAYRGHIFWDELYILPLYDLHFPQVTKSVLLYRYRRLDQARAYAREHGYAGAMFPWQSGSDGREETQVVHLNPLSGTWGPDYSSLQRHVGLAIAINIWRHYCNSVPRYF